MTEAASMFYMLADKLRRAIKKRPKLNAKELDKYTRVLFKEVHSEALPIPIYPHAQLLKIYSTSPWENHCACLMWTTFAKRSMNIEDS